ncbi:phage tail protein [Flavobacterium sp. AG291]|uniref:phage tail protein n=1 Tax=Flavobacterium sp. AG291 TaxID=2184000 RepID=UPI000E0C6E0F|nr:tail fiber protein [Flavobacterium sp. AG291]RDI14620.1 microcystin-dependent protein [Flavobacterium sp. AG291]
MDEELIGCIKLFAGNFAPRGYMLCNGQLLSISQNTALFSILGTTYGGDGVQTFGLPNLQGTVPIGVGSKAGTSYVLGQAAGTPTVTLTTAQMPMHTHTGPGTVSASPANATDSVPARGMSIAAPGGLVGRTFTGTLGYAASTPSVDLTSNVATAISGGSQPFSIMQPYLAMNYIICVSGIFPSRN